jgi:O-succinylbenzoate synthase
MKIDQIDLYEVRMRLKVRFQASTHAADELRHHLIRVRSGDVVGWGECSAPNDPYYLGETADAAWHMLEGFLIPSVLGKDFVDVATFADAYHHVKANTFARAGLEMAAWDLFGRATGKSGASMLGGTRTEIFSGVSLGMEPFEALCDRVAQHVAEGYRRVKLKISPGHDAELFERLRPRFPDVAFMADANSTYTLADTERLKRLDAFDLMMIEQPLAWDDLIDHARLQTDLKTPICLDESVRSFVQAKDALELRSCRVLNVKAGRVGGMLEAKRVHDACVAHGVPVWCGGMHDYGVGRAANVALASLPGFSLPGDVSGSDKYFEEDVVEPPIVAKNGAIEVPARPGLGYDVVEERVRKRTARSAQFRAG